MLLPFYGFWLSRNCFSGGEVGMLRVVFIPGNPRRGTLKRRGFPLLWQQYAALLQKNLLLSWRNKTATFMQLFSSLFFIFLLFSIQKATEASYSTSMADSSVTDPKPLLLPPIPPCEDKFYTKLPCFDLLWSGNASAAARRIVTNIMANNPGRPIPESKVGASVWLLRKGIACFELWC